MPTRLLILLALICALAAQASEARIALVIGNADYPDRPLQNPLNDAQDLGAALTRLGFEVLLRQNLNEAGMKEAIAEFGDRLAQSRGMGLFFFSGHGVQSRSGRNYLLPVGRRYQRERDIELFAIDARQVLAELERVGNALNVVILDACRDNPLVADDKSLARGLSRMEAPSGSLIAYATAPGRTASDNPDGRNGLYTKHLIQAIQTPGLRLEDVFAQVRQQVERESQRAQSPEEVSKLVGRPFYFLPPIDDPLRRAEAQNAQQRADEAAWRAVAQGRDLASLRAFLASDAASRFFAPARALLDELENEAWQRIANERRQADVNRYYQDFPDGRRLAQVQAIGLELAEERLWQQAMAGDAAALAQLPVLYPHGRYAARARARLEEDRLRRERQAGATDKPRDPVYVPPLN